ncbi:MAG TPA: tripartite tricarboxylate transporter permease [archaeon]|nr:tripartite tricarboxylate transporter permease [archaeon]
MLEILLFAVLGIIVGVFFGLIPGLHPNLIILFVPLLSQLNLQPAVLIAFVVSLGISNTFLDFIPSMLFGAPDSDKSLAVLPAHKMLMRGNGYDAIKLAVVGGIGSVIFILLTLPLIILIIPRIFQVSQPFTYALLIFIVFIMVFSETGKKKLISFFCFILAGAIGIFSSQLPIDRTLILFPMLSGMFGISVMLFSANQKIKIPKRTKEIHVTGRQTRRSIIFGSIGGIISGLLPGVGSSEIASLASVDKNEKSFILTIGAITISNAILSILSLWLIQRSRSGVAVVLEQLVQIGFNEFILVVAVALLVAGLSAIITLKMAKRTLSSMEKVNYANISKIVILLIILMTLFFTGIYGMLLLVTCTALGIFANMAGIRRGILMGVLILPTIIFYLPF